MSLCFGHGKLSIVLVSQASTFQLCPANKVTAGYQKPLTIQPHPLMESAGEAVAEVCDGSKGCPWSRVPVIGGRRE